MGKSRSDTTPYPVVDDPAVESDTSSTPIGPEVEAVDPVERTGNNKSAIKKKKIVGRPSLFYAHEIRWIRERMPEFDKLVLGSTKCIEDKREIKKWKERTWSELYETHKGSLARPGNWKKVSS